MPQMALVIIDMLNDFVKGTLKNERSERIVPTIRELIETARKRGIPVIYSNDAHLPELDKEFDIWGSHAVAGTKGAQVIDELKPKKGDYIVPKRRYSSFFETDLDLTLREMEVSVLIITGQHTNCCVKHTTADAFFRGYKTIIPQDAVEALSEEEHRWGLEYLKRFYKADISTTRKVTRDMKAASFTEASPAPKK